MAKFNAADFVISKAKPLPIILLLDTSGTMGYDRKIETLNKAVRDMLGSLKREETLASEYLMSIITFGNGGVTEVTNGPTSASKLEYTDLTAGGMTPLGGALDVARAIVEDKEKTPSRAYRPLVVLICDGMPNDDWQGRLERFISEGRTAKCDRMALAVGCNEGSAEWAMLERFVAGTEHSVQLAETADQIYKFFAFVTMSVVQRASSQNPNEVPKDAAVLKAAREAAQLPAPAVGQLPAPADDDVIELEAIPVEPDDDDSEDGFKFSWR